MPEHPAQSSDIEQVLPAGFKVAKWLGVGNFGKVCRAKGQGGFECAFKIIEMTRGKAVGIKEFRALRMIRRIKPHRNLIDYLGVWLTTSDGTILDNADQIEDEDLQQLDVAELLIQMPLAVKSLEVRLKECRREFRAKTDRQPGDLPGIPLPELLPYMRGVAEALDHLHSPIHPLTDKGLGWIMHRDIKPANILIDRTGNVVVADYGVARAVGTNVKSTQSGAGTPIYSAPEQITERVDVVDPASDQYSLAITYYELRTGMLPFKDDVLGDVNSLKLAHTLGKLDFSLLPRNEVNVLKRATHRTVNQRYPSCLEFIDELWKANGVMPMQSGFIQRPKPRPVSDSSAEFGLPPPPQPLPPPTDQPLPADGNRTPFEAGTAPDMRKALADEAPTQAKASGTLLLGDLVRATPFQAPSAPSNDDNLPIAPTIEDDAPAAPWESGPPKTKSKSSIDINTEPAKGSWHPAATPKKPKSSFDLGAPPEAEPKKGKSPILLIAVGVVLAAAVGGGIFFAMKNSGDPNKAGTNEQVKNGTDTPIDKKDPPKVEPKIEPKVEPKVDPKMPPPDEIPKRFADALASLSKVGDGDVAAITAALDSLNGIPGEHPEFGKAALTLSTEWSALRDLLVKPRLTLAQSQTVAEWSPPNGLKPAHESDLRRVYNRLRTANPTAGLRFQYARALVRGDGAFAAAFGAPASALGFPRPGLDKLDELLELNPPDAGLRKQAESLKSAWEAALKFDRAFKMTAARDVEVKDLTEARDAMKTVSGLEPADESSLKDFYRMRLATLVQRFALKPVGPTAAAEWSELAGKLPKSNELDSPWRDLVAAESEFLANVLASPMGKAELVAPAATKLEPKDLREYRAFVNAEIAWQNAKTPQQRRDAAETLIEKIGSAGALLDVPARKLALGAVLASTATRDFKQPVTTPETPFTADPKNHDPAKACLVRANEFLMARPEQVAVRRDLLRLAAFPKVDNATAKLANVTTAEIEAAPANERLALWFAFARTRDLKAPGGAADAIKGFEKVSEAVRKDLGADLTPLIQLAGSLQDFLAGVPDDQKGDAATKLFLPVVRELFPRRAKLKPAEKTLLVDLAGTAWKIGKSDDLELLHSFVKLELKGERVEESAASSLHDRAGTARTRALLGLVQLRNAKTETSASAKIARLELGAGNVEKALELLKRDDPDRLADLLARELLLGHRELGVAHEAAARQALKSPQPETVRYKQAVAEFSNAVLSLDKALGLAKGQADLANEIRQMQLALGRCNWELSSTSDWEKKQAETRKALEAIEAGTTEHVESRYWLALSHLYGNSLSGHSTPRAYDDDKANLVGRTQTKKTELDALDALIAKFPLSDRGPFGVELLEWRACVAAARANASNTMSDSDRSTRLAAALKALDDLEKVDALCAAHRRIQFLAYRAEKAAGNVGDAELEHAEVKKLFGPPDAILATLQKATTTNRLPDSPDRNRRIVDAAMALVRVHTLSRGSKTADLAKLRSALKALQDAKIEAAVVVPALEELAMSFAIASSRKAADSDNKAQIAAAAVAVELFDHIGRLDPKLALVTDHVKALKGNFITVGAYRDYAATLLERSIDIKAEDLKDNPDKLETLIRIDTAMAQAIQMLQTHPNPDDLGLRLDTAKKNRNSLKPNWFDKGLDPAIEAAEKAGDTERAKAFKAFKAKLAAK